MSPRLCTPAVSAWPPMMRFCSELAPCELVSISPFTVYSMSSRMSVIAMSSRNSLVKTATELAVSRSRVLRRLPARVFSAA